MSAASLGKVARNPKMPKNKALIFLIKFITTDPYQYGANLYFFAINFVSERYSQNCTRIWRKFCLDQRWNLSMLSLPAAV